MALGRGWLTYSDLLNRFGERQGMDGKQ
jgi:hypothetical protein